MADSAADDGNDEVDMPSAEDEMGAAVDEALAQELKRQKARFIQAMLEVDRGEGVGRREQGWDDAPYRALGLDRPDDPRD